MGEGSGDSTRKFVKAIGRDTNGTTHSFSINTGNVHTGYLGYAPNDNKVVHLCIIRLKEDEISKLNKLSTLYDTLDGKDQAAPSWDNWKSGTANVRNRGNVDLSNLVVDKTVNPIISDLKVSGGLNIGVSDVQQQMQQGAGEILGKISDMGKKIQKYSNYAVLGGQALQNASLTGGQSKEAAKQVEGRMGDGDPKAADVTYQGTLMSRYAHFPIFDATKTAYSGPGSISLEFRFGAGGYFDGEREVVRPIAVLESIFAPAWVGADDPNNPSKFLMAPMASPALFYAGLFGATTGTFGAIWDDLQQALVGLVGAFDVSDAEGFRDAVGGVVEGVGTAGYELGANVQKEVINAQDAAIEALMPYTNLVFLRLGNSILGPLYVSSVNHVFDYSTVDERGYPYKGTITLAVEQALTPSNEDILSSMGYRLGSA